MIRGQEGSAKAVYSTLRLNRRMSRKQSRVCLYLATPSLSSQVPSSHLL